MPTLCGYHHVVTIEDEMNTDRMVSLHHVEEAMKFPRWKRRCYLPNLLLSIFLILFLVGEPVASFSSPSTLIGLGISRKGSHINSSKNHTVLLTSTSQGIPDNEEDTDSTAQAKEQSLGRRVSSSSPLDKARSWNEKVRTAYRRRTNADPSFFAKSITEILVAAGTQLMAEWNRRGASRMVTELDFVVPAVLTAVFGKYYSMWRTAKTLDDGAGEENPPSMEINAGGDPVIFGLPVPTNAFQPQMADGSTTPTTKQRLGSVIAPVPALFKAGTIASGVGYGITTILIGLRTWLIPSYRTETVPVNVLYASVYTGCFMAVVSNLRYQVLQGLIEPIVIDRWIFLSLADGEEGNEATNSRRFLVASRSVLIFVVRWLNGLLGSVLAISGMRMFGLQRLKSS